MPLGEALEDDDYVVSLLLKDAEANKKRYLTNGLGSLLSKRSSAPKPNTRFLKNVVRDVDAHNAALKAKEEEESKARLRGMKEGSSGFKRGREGGDGGDGGDGGEREVKKRKSGENSGRWATALGGLGDKGSKRRERVDDKTERKKDDGRVRRHGRSRSRSRSQERRDKRRSKHSKTRSIYTASHPDDTKRSSHKHHRRRSRSPTSSPDRPSRRQQKASREPKFSHALKDDDSDDPLTDIIGPKPAPEVLPRGRGAYKTATIDSRFDPNYNPRADTSPSPPPYDENGKRDDWDMALEAMRDRAKWRTQGAERLKAAGFDEDTVKKFQGSSRGALLQRKVDGSLEKDIDDVRWAKKGEDREWDRGKVVQGDDIELRPSWVKAKGK